MVGNASKFKQFCVTSCRVRSSGNLYLTVLTMIFQRAAQREFAQTAAAVFVALFAILLTTQLIRLLGQAAGGKTASEAVVALLGFAALQYLPVLLSLTLFIAILLSLSRMYRDSEMSIWFSSGLPLTAWIWPVLRFAVPVVLAITALSLLLTPWASEQRETYQKRMSNRDEASRVTPGAFRESSQGERVFFVEAVGGGRTIRVCATFSSIPFSMDGSALSLPPKGIPRWPRMATSSWC